MTFHYYSCRKCKYPLFTSKSLFEGSFAHAPDGALGEFRNKRGGDEAGERRAKVNDDDDGEKEEEIARRQRWMMQRQGHKNCTSYFLHEAYPEWMRDVIHNEESRGKLNCPKCAQKVGSFDWSGEQCSCKQWVNPAVQFQKSKVDERVLPPNSPLMETFERSDTARET